MTKRMRILFSLTAGLFVLGLAIAPAQAHCGKCGKGEAHAATHDIIDTAVEAGSFSTLVAAVKAAGGEIYNASDREHFREVKLPKGRELKETDVAIDVMHTDLLINMPVAKSHGSCTITVSMKNWMGSVKNRKSWHMKGVHQCIADVNTFIKADLIVVDATRIMTTDGPQGPGNVEHPKQIIIGTDPVAVDAYAATLFKLKPFDVEHIKIAHDMKLGVGDLDRVEVVHIEV